MEQPRQPVQGEDYTEVADQNRPEGYEPQPNLQLGQTPYIEEREPDLIVEDDDVTDAKPDDGVADGDDDTVVFFPPDERPKHL